MQTKYPFASSDSAGWVVVGRTHHADPIREFYLRIPPGLDSAARRLDLLGALRGLASREAEFMTKEALVQFDPRNRDWLDFWTNRPVSYSVVGVPPRYERVLTSHDLTLARERRVLEEKSPDEREAGH